MALLGCGERRDAHQSVHAIFVFECAVYIFPRDFNREIAKAAVVVLVFMQNFDTPTALPDIAAIHFIEHAGKILGIIAAGTSDNRENCAPLFILSTSLKFVF